MKKQNAWPASATANTAGLGQMMNANTPNEAQNSERRIVRKEKTRRRSGDANDPASVVTYMHNVGPCVAANLRTWSPSGSRDVVGGGVPCQSFSEGGARGGLGDIRGTVVADALRIADEARAKVFWLEN